MSEQRHSDQSSTVIRARARRALPTGFEILVEEGPDAAEPDRKKAFSIDLADVPSAWIGKARGATVQLTDSEVSRSHAKLEFDEESGLLRVKDAGSANGVILGGVRVFDAHWEDGATMRLGSTVLRIAYRTSKPTAQLPSATRFGELVGQSRAMRRLYPLCERLAQQDVRTLIEGETGTGKGVLARALHENGARASKPFVVFDCAGVAPTLTESELFGHERGAFTGAIRRHIGVFERANGGTLLLDEIGDLDLILQKKLLTAVQDRVIRRVGGEQSIPADVRILAATRRNLEFEVQEGRFREDLLYRLNVARITLPPLRRRRDDIPHLVQHFCTRHGGRPEMIGDEMLRRWQNDPWPGNVRELENAVERRIKLGDLAEFDAAPPSQTDGRAAAPQSPSAAAETACAAQDVIAAVIALPLEEAERRLLDELNHRWVQRMLQAHEGNVSKAAEAAGLGRRNFQKRMKRAESLRPPVRYSTSPRGGENVGE